MLNLLSHEGNSGDAIEACLRGTLQAGRQLLDIELKDALWCCEGIQASGRKSSIFQPDFFFSNGSSLPSSYGTCLRLASSLSGSRKAFLHAGFVWSHLTAVNGTRQSAPAQRPEVRFCIGLRQSSRSDRRQAAAGPRGGRLQIHVQPVRAVALWLLGRGQHKVYLWLLRLSRTHLAPFQAGASFHCITGHLIMRIILPVLAVVHILHASIPLRKPQHLVARHERNAAKFEPQMELQ